MIAAAPATSGGPRPWWESRGFALAAVLIAALPLLYPRIPPLTDLLGHMGQYRIELDTARSPLLQRYFSVQWRPMGNLGVDVLMIALAPLVGLEPAIKLIMIAVPMMTVAGMLWIAREVHGRIPPTAGFALPFAFHGAFLYGFANFSLSMALAMLAFGLWLCLGRQRRIGLRTALFVPISFILYFAHVYGWGLLGLLVFAAETGRRHEDGANWFEAAWRGALTAAILAGPIVVILLWRSQSSSGSAIVTKPFLTKTSFILMALRDRWQWFDVGSLMIAACSVVLVRRLPGSTMNPLLSLAAAILALAFLLLPWRLFGSAYADMRLGPFIIALAILSVGPVDDAMPSRARAVALAALAFFLIRIAANGASFALAANDQTAKLAALDHVPMGARVATLVNAGCPDRWSQHVNDHLGSMVIVRRQGLSNDQWLDAGFSLISITNGPKGRFSSDDSQTVMPVSCANGVYATMDQSLAALPPGSFDYLWLVDPPELPPRLAAFAPVWRGANSILYRLPAA